MRANQRRSTLLLSLVATLSGCMTSTYRTGLPGGGEKHLDSASYHLFGLVGDKTLDLAQVCPNGVSEWHDYVTLGDWLITCVACGGLIYGSETIEVECAGNPGRAGTTFLLVPDRAHHETVVIPRSSAPMSPAPAHGDRS